MSLGRLKQPMHMGIINPTNRAPVTFLRRSAAKNAQRNIAQQSAISSPAEGIVCC